MHPDPFDQGYEAYHNMVPLHENPWEQGIHQECNEEARQWETGWLAAEEESEE